MRETEANRRRMQPAIPLRAASVAAEGCPNHCPAWTAVGVTSLAMPAMLIEIKAVAVKRG